MMDVTHTPRSTFRRPAIALVLLFWQWQPMGGTIWSIENPAGRVVLQALCAMGFLLVLLSTFLINHFDLFGLRQVWLQFRGVPYTKVHFVTPAPYRFVRHPFYCAYLTSYVAGLVAVRGCRRDTDRCRRRMDEGTNARRAERRCVRARAAVDVVLEDLRHHARGVPD